MNTVVRFKIAAVLAWPLPADAGTLEQVLIGKAIEAAAEAGADADCAVVGVEIEGDEFVCTYAPAY